MKTIREKAVGKATVRLLETKDGFAGVVIREGASSTPRRGDDADELWRELMRDLDTSSAAYFGFDGARARFLRIFPAGFEGAPFLKQERGYKVTARDLLLSSVPLEAARKAGADECSIVARVYAKTNLLSQFEQARTREVLKSKDGPVYVRAAAAVADGDTKVGLKTIEDVFRAHGQPSWPAATYLPFLWRGDAHMFLKPQVTIDFAQRVGHRFARDYGPRLEAGAYESLLDLARLTERELSPLQPRDRIDVQSFIWVVGAYDDQDAESVRAMET